MSTTTANPQRTREDWDEVAEKILPSLEEHGGITPEMRDKYDIGYLYGLKMALAKRGRNIHGQELVLRPIKGKRPNVQAREIAERRQKKEPYWKLEVEAGMTHGEMSRLLKEHGYSFSTGMPNGHKNGHKS